MTATPYTPITFTSDTIPVAKLQAMANNDQWLFENMPRIRYAASGITQDTGVKMLAGKTVIPPSSTNDYTDCYVYFGSYFSASCKPVVTAVVEPAAGRILTTLSGLTFGVEMDYRGFRAHVYQSSFPNSPVPTGWLHWISVGY